jgi:hypothetical protein
MVVLIVACLAGICTGLRYNFLVLVPLTLAAIMTSSFTSVWHGQTISGALLALVIPAVGLQGGYMIGLTGRDVVAQFVSRFRAVPSKGV